MSNQEMNQTPAPVKTEAYVEVDKNMLKKILGCVREYKKPTILTFIFIVGEAFIETLIPFITARLISNISLGGEDMMSSVIRSIFVSSRYCRHSMSHRISHVPSARSKKPTWRSISTQGPATVIRSKRSLRSQTSSRSLPNTDFPP